MSIIRSPEQIFDIRLSERNKNKGLYDDKDYKKWVKELPDVSENADYITAADLFEEARQPENARRENDDDGPAESGAETQE